MNMYELVESKYSCNRRTRIDIVEDGLPYSTMTVNIPECYLNDNEFIMNSNHEKYCGKINEFLIKIKAIKTSGKKVANGYQIYSIYELTKPIESIDLSNFINPNGY